MEVHVVKNVVWESKRCLIWLWNDLGETGCGCEVEKYSNCDVGSQVDGGQSHVLWTPDGVLRLVHDGDDDVSGERCPHDGKCQHDEMSGDEICEACRCVETCLHGKTFVGMWCVVLMS